MINKSFVSIYFLANKLQILQLDSAKKKVKKIASVNIPEGIIKGIGGDGKGAFAYHVEDIEGLSRILKTSWNKLHIKQRSVGIIVPEFSTFTKLFSVPKLPMSELDEAVRWQIQEIIPTDIKTMVLDWKIAARSDEGYQILVAAMQKEILKTYIGSVEAAGLFPLVVEMPSLSLSRAAGFDAVGKLIVYKDQEKFMLVVVNGEQVFAASVVDPDENIAAMAGRMISHYSEAKVVKVCVGGGMDEKTVTQLKEKLGKEILPINISVEGLEISSVQEYLIPISLQQKHSVEPSNPATINLLPPLLVAKYKSANTRLRVWGLSLVITLFIWVCFFATLGSYLFLGQQKMQMASENLSINRYIQNRKDLAEKVKNINDLAGKVVSIKTNMVYPQEMFAYIEDAKGTGVKVHSYKMDLDKGEIIVKGIAEDRPAFIAFKNNLEANPQLGNIEIPISSLEVERNLDFQISFSYLPAAAKTTTKK